MPTLRFDHDRTDAVRPDPLIAPEVVPGPATAAELRFPDGPRLELDQLLGQLVGRATEVLSTQGRLRGLLHANQLIIGDLGLPAVLRHIVDAARDLVGARYAALGVIDPRGGLSQFVHAGMTSDQVAAIGELPQGKGLLGALIDDPEPIRLRRIAEDEHSCGFPAHHPPMDSFLGVPIRIRDEVFGNLYLAESSNGEFSSEDEQLVQALAATAAIAIDNARHYETARTHQDWLRASTAITNQILDPDTEHPLHLIAAAVRDVAAAELVLVMQPVQDGQRMRIEVADGPNGEQLIGSTVPTDGSLSGRVMTTGTALRANDPAAVPPFTATAARVEGLDVDLTVGRALLLPLRGSRQVHGVLAITRTTASTGFSDEDSDMATGFAAQAALALDRAQARSAQQDNAMHDERDRIAVNLHNHVVRRLTGTILALHSIAAAQPRGPGANRIQTTITDLDDTIRQLRSDIFDLHPPSQPTDGRIRSSILDLIVEMTPALGFDPTLQIQGPIDDIDDIDPIGEGADLLAVLRESLSTIARHGRARTAEATVIATKTQLSLRVVDDGDGIDPAQQQPSNLTDLRRRTEDRGGRLTIDADTSGTRLTWTVSLLD